MRLFSSKRRVAIFVVVVLLCLFLVRPGVSRLKARIANSISRAVGRPTEIGSVHLRFLPQPGFDLENLVIYEDAAFGAEPMLRAQEVTAVVRLWSLARGRLDIARLELTEPSLNLVRRADGRWNLEDLLERSDRTPLAPTAKSKSEARPGFPYIEASSGRINFKAGQEKKSYTLLNADFALWQESENTWGARLKAEPLRTDMNLSDTGLLRLSGIWQRAGSLRETPLRFSVEWDRAQLGQLTKLVMGNDKGWRGTVRLEAALTGVPAAMQVAVDAAIEDFHRYDISSSRGLNLTAHCDGSYSSVEAMARGILCRAPVGEGMITLHGDAGLPGVHKVDLGLNLESVPVSSMAELVRRAKKDLPVDLVSTGNVEGSFSVKEDGVSPGGAEFQGQGEITNLRLQSANTKVELAAEGIPFALSSGRTKVHDAPKDKTTRRLQAEVLPPPEELHIEYGPFPVALGRPVAAQARGWLSRSGYGMVVRGDGEVSHTLRLAGLLGLPAVQSNVEGTAQLELQIAGSWAGNVSGTIPEFSLPEIIGTVQLRNLHARIRGVDGPIEISAAELQLLPDEARVEKLSVRAADSLWTGSFVLPRGCGAPGACLAHFNLSTEELGLTELSEWLSSPPNQRPWYRRLTSDAVMAPAFLKELRAAGNVNAKKLRIRGVVVGQVSAALGFADGKLKVSNLQADVFGGKYQGDWLADFSKETAAFSGSGTLTGISLGQIADAMHDPWISGTAGGTYQITASGADAATFWRSAEGGLQFEVRDGVLPHISLSDSLPLRVARWQGHAQLRDGKIEVDKGRLVCPVGVYEIGGTTSLGRELDFKLTRTTDVKPGVSVYRITGTVAEPRVALTPVAETQARLKP
jgi:hypothetical protein